MKGLQLPIDQLNYKQNLLLFFCLQLPLIIAAETHFLETNAWPISTALSRTYLCDDVISEASFGQNRYWIVEFNRIQQHIQISCKLIAAHEVTFYFICIQVSIQHRNALQFKIEQFKFDLCTLLIATRKQTKKCDAFNYLLLMVSPW